MACGNAICGRVSDEDAFSPSCRGPRIAPWVVRSKRSQGRARTHESSSTNCCITKNSNRAAGGVHLTDLPVLRRVRRVVWRARLGRHHQKLVWQSRAAFFSASLQVSSRLSPSHDYRAHSPVPLPSSATLVARYALTSLTLDIILEFLQLPPISLPVSTTKI